MSDQKTLAILASKGREALKYLEKETALQIFKDIIEIDESYLDGWVGLGQVYYELGKLADAQHLFEKSLAMVEAQFGSRWRQKKISWQVAKNRPVLRLAHGLGLVAFRQGKNTAAKEWFELEQALDPSLEAPLAMLRDIAAGRKFDQLKSQSLDV